jgi:hypothetical protein
VNARPKRFFDAEAVDRLFARGWRALGKAELYTLKYGLPKALWEIAVAKDDYHLPSFHSLGSNNVRPAVNSIDRCKAQGT